MCMFRVQGKKDENADLGEAFSGAGKSSKLVLLLNNKVSVHVLVCLRSSLVLVYNNRPV